MRDIISVSENHCECLFSVHLTRTHHECSVMSKLVCCGLFNILSTDILVDHNTSLSHLCRDDAYDIEWADNCISWKKELIIVLSGVDIDVFRAGWNDFDFFTDVDSFSDNRLKNEHFANCQCTGRLSIYPDIDSIKGFVFSQKCETGFLDNL